MRFLSHNLHLKILCLVGAVILAFYVRRQEDTLRRGMLLPVSVTAPPGQSVVEPPRGTNVEVDLEGPASEVRAIADEEVKLVFDTSRVPPGKRVQVPISVELPDKYRRVSVSWRPRTLAVRLVSDTSRALPVAVKILARPEGWEFTEAPRATPDRVTVIGTQEAVQKVAAITAPVAISAGERINELVTLQALDAANQNVTATVRLEPSQVTVTGYQEPVVLQKRVPVQPLFVVPPGQRVISVEVNPPRVRVTGPSRAMSELYLLETESFSIPPTQSQHTQETAVLAPRPDLEVVPPRVRVTVRLQPVTPTPQRPAGEGEGTAP